MSNFAGKPVAADFKTAAAAMAVEVVAAAAMANPVAATAVGLAAIAVSLGLYILFDERLVRDNSTMREIEARLERQEEECRCRVAEANQRAQVANTSATEKVQISKLGEEKALAQAQEAEEALLKGIRPVVMPTREQFSAAKQRVQYDPAKFHFAVCGTAGSGKSSVINAFRGLKPSDEGAAKVTVTECTSEVTRYPDPSNKLPCSRFVWYDIPGAGTTNVPDWQYFNDQGLFVFDLIIMVYDVRFTTIDVGIIENCLRFNIPLLIVRSKSDQHIENMIKAETNSVPGDTDYEEHYQEMTENYVKATRSDFNDHMETMAENPDIDSRYQLLLRSHKVYIVSESTLRGLLQMKTNERNRRTPNQSRIIDENLLIDNMLNEAARRRCHDPDKQKTEGVHAVAEKTKNNSSDAKPAGVMIAPKASENEDHSKCTLKSGGNEEDHYIQSYVGHLQVGRKTS